MEKPMLYILTGPTASGKTAVSILLAKRMNAEILSADSIQIYRGMDIGSAKPGEEERQGVPHHMIDVAAPTERDFSVARYREGALACIADIAARGKAPLVVGGTGLYVNALIYPLSFPSAPPNEVLRAHWSERERAEKGSAHKRLLELDPETARRLHPNDAKRVIRAIEVLEGTRKTLSQLGADFTRRDDESLPYRPVLAGLTMPREMLYRRIERRVDAMLASDLEEEVKALLSAGVDAALPAMQGLGYKQMAAYLRGECTRDEAVETIKRETRRFAKRQLTWFRREERIRWFDVTAYEDICALTGAVYDYFTEVSDGR
jgi:tRNA dimethylallyltransferase